MKLSAIVSLIISATVFFSCDPAEVAEPKATTPRPLINPLAGLDYADAVLCAEESEEWVDIDGGSLFVEESRGLAYFFPKGDKTKYVKAGFVKMDSITLSEEPDHTYSKPGFLFPAGYSFGEQITWTVEGSTDFFGFIEPISGFPSMPKLNQAITEIDQTEAFRLETLQKITGADSVLFAIRSDTVEIAAKKDSTGSYYIFPVYDLKKLPKGPAQMEITAIRHRTVKKQNRTIVLVNQRMGKKQVEIL